MSETEIHPVIRQARFPFHVLAKPIGPLCNLSCRYCFYLEKAALFPASERYPMSDAVLAQYVRQYIGTHPGPEVNFAWQGGEPTLLGIDFFRKALELQHRHSSEGKTVSNSFQTNGMLIDEKWCEFLREHHFLVGLSVDGPRELHDAYRRDKEGLGTFDRVMGAIRLFKRHGVEFNTLTVIQRANARRPREVYRFLREHGSGFIQFIPLVERPGRDGAGADPPDLRSAAEPTGVTAESVRPADYGEFLCAVFDEWVRRDVGTVFVTLFDVMLGIWMGLPASLCVYSETCGRATAIEHTGDVYACDHFVYPAYRVGSIMQSPLADLVDGERMTRFAMDKRDALPAYCRACSVQFACRGGCPKHRFMRTPSGEPGLNYLCAGYRRFLGHIDPLMQRMAALVSAGRPAADIMAQAAQEREAGGRAAGRPAGRNDPCPCGSGLKFKKCCWGISHEQNA